MDFIRKTFRTHMVFWPAPTPGISAPGPGAITPPLQPATGNVGLGMGGSPYLVPVRWFYCQPNAKIQDYPTAFCSAGWDIESEWNAPYGEVNELGRFLKRIRPVTPTTATGQQTCNTPEQWANGLQGPSAFAVPYDNQGIPLCCNTQLGAAAVGAIGFRERTIAPFAGIGLTGGMTRVGAIGLVGQFNVIPAAANISFAGFLGQAGAIVLGSIVPAYGNLGFSAVAIVPGAIGFGETLPAAGSVELGETLPAGGVLIVGAAALELAGVALVGDLPQLAGVELGGPFPATGQVAIASPWIPAFPDLGLDGQNYDFSPVVVAYPVLKSPDYIQNVTGVQSTLATSFTLNVPAWESGLLVVCVMLSGAGGANAVKSVTFKGTAMTPAVLTNPGGTIKGCVAIYTLTVTAGINGSVVVTPISGSVQYAVSVGVAVNTAAGIVDATGRNNNTTGTGPITASVTTTKVGNEVIIAAAAIFGDSGGPPSWVGGFINQANVNYTDTSSADVRLLVAKAVVPAPATNSTTVSGYTAANSWALELAGIY